MVTKVKTGIVFEGGAFRTIFSCGVMDALVENDIMPDYMIGVSAGAAYGVSMASKQPRRNLDVLMKYRNDKRYLGLSMDWSSPMKQSLMNLICLIMMLLSSIRAISTV